MIIKINVDKKQIPQEKSSVLTGESVRIIESKEKSGEFLVIYKEPNEADYVLKFSCEKEALEMYLFIAETLNDRLEEFREFEAEFQYYSQKASTSRVQKSREKHRSKDDNQRSLFDV